MTKTEMPNDIGAEPKNYNPFIAALSSIGGVVISAALIWISSSQLQLTTDMALTQQQVKQLSGSLERYFQDQTGQLDNLIDNQNRIWPRLRAHGENIEILRRELEAITNHDIDLVEPDKF